MLTKSEGRVNMQVVQEDIRLAMGTGFVHIPEGLYDAVYKGVGTQEIKPKDGTASYKLLKHRFEVEVNGEKLTLDTLSPMSLSLGNKTGKIARAISGREVPVKELFVFNDYVGRKLKLVVEDKPSINGPRSDLKNFLKIGEASKDFPVGAP
jgi:hypothetical protein